MARGFYDHVTDDIWPSLRDLQLSTTKNTVVLMVRLPFSVLDFRCLRNTRNFWDSGTSNHQSELLRFCAAPKQSTGFLLCLIWSFTISANSFSVQMQFQFQEFVDLKNRAPHVLNNWTGCKKNSFAKKHADQINKLVKVKTIQFFLLPYRPW